MGDLLNTGVSALQAFQQGLAVTANNISNSATEGYTRESVQLAPSLAQNFGAGYVGTGVSVTGVVRNLNLFAQSQSQTANQAAAQQNAYVDVAQQVDSTLGSTSNGIAAALAAFYGAYQTLSTNPSSTSLRSAVLSQAQTLAQAITQAGQQIASVTGTINSQVGSTVTQINALTSNIASINGQIAQAVATGAGQAPNTLLDQRDQLVGQLSQLTGVRTNIEASGMVDVSVGSGQAVVVGATSTPLAVTNNPYVPGQSDIVYGTGSAVQDITSQVAGGTLGGLLSAQSQIVAPALSSLGQIATAVGLSTNNLQAQGATANNTFGANLFNVPGPTVTASSTNTDAATYGAPSALISNLSALGTASYVLQYSTSKGWTATDAQTGASVAVNTLNATTLQIPADSSGAAPALTVNLPRATPPASGDTFLLQPTAAAATGLTVALTNPNGLAAAGLNPATAGANNASSVTITGLSASTPGSALPSQATTLQFNTPATSYTVTVGSGAPSAAIPYTPGSAITVNGYSFNFSGIPAAGDSFTIPSQTGAGIGSANSIALAVAGLQSGGLLANGTISITTAYANAVGAIGNQTYAATTAQTAAQAVANQATQALQASSGVNLDEEGAKLVQWQQAYAAAGRVISIAQQTFQTLLTALNG